MVIRFSSTLAQAKDSLPKLNMSVRLCLPCVYREKDLLIIVAPRVDLNRFENFIMILWLGLDWAITVDKGMPT